MNLNKGIDVCEFINFDFHSNFEAQFIKISFHYNFSLSYKLIGLEREREIYSWQTMATNLRGVSHLAPRKFSSVMKKGIDLQTNSLKLKPPWYFGNVREKPPSSCSLNYRMYSKNQLLVTLKKIVIVVKKRKRETFKTSRLLPLVLNKQYLMRF